LRSHADHLAELEQECALPQWMDRINRQPSPEQTWHEEREEMRRQYAQMGVAAWTPEHPARIWLPGELRGAYKLAGWAALLTLAAAIGWAIVQGMGLA
jgi:hypothetical protein